MEPKWLHLSQWQSLVSFSTQKHLGKRTPRFSAPTPTPSSSCVKSRKTSAMQWPQHDLKSTLAETHQWCEMFLTAKRPIFKYRHRSPSMRRGLPDWADQLRDGPPLSSRSSHS